MTAPSVAVAELAPLHQEPDAELHAAQQLAVHSIQQASHVLRHQQDRHDADQAVPEPTVDTELAAFMHESLSRRIQSMDQSDPFVITAQAVLARLQQPTQEAIDGALSLINHLTVSDEQDGRAAAIQRPKHSEEFPYADWVFNFTPTEKSIQMAISTYRVAKSTRNHEVMRIMMAYFAEFNVDIPQTS